jgi:hemolysin D
MAIILAFAALALAWAMFGQIDIVASAQGKLIPDARSKVLQALEAASIAALHVQDGQKVKQGELLIELDATQTGADHARIREELKAARREAARAQALLAALDSGRAPRLTPAIPGQEEQHAAEQRLLEGEWAAHITQMAQLDAEIRQRRAELQGNEELLAKLQETLPIIRARATDYQRLQQENFISRHGWLEKEQARVEAERDLSAQAARRQEIHAALAVAERQRAAQQAQTRRATLDRLREAEQKALALEQEHIKAGNRVEHMRLTAPVAGTVQQLALHTLGGVVTPAQALLVIVPDDLPLEVEAFVENKDIGFVRPGQEVEVKLEAFPFTKYGTLKGRLTQVSNDAIQDEKRGLVYAARIQLARNSLDVDGKTVNLSPGMAVTVEVKTGKRRVIEFFMGPLMQYQSESLRER